MDKFLANRYIFLFSRLLIGLLFVFSGITKLMEPVQEFALQVEQYQLLPQILIMPFAYALPWVELIFGGLLILGIWVKLDAGILGLTMTAFIIAISQAMIRGIGLTDCGCFGEVIEVGETPGQVLIRDIVLMLPIIYLFFSKTKFFSMDKYLLK
ncbi:DoxX family membrane protein [Candidatus Saccharibacteria bacterium]|nr:DoxX family membrane protein [Candidatus Saccharibacteria bacterium]NIV71471.1 DoxX family membrane protein [Calditrichia bacterium]NIV98009.1 DoxX family membrane protein [Candidatus Saccharibacteria bacterium]NIW80513.1 DoxX family membrane protein [Calditrichia bacterium]